ncbi:MAG: YHYH protein [Acidobacteria bacterium]|nr:YHYH protein [Acidobacteriota bacterium]MBI3427787.1 YHYH protein [Acidobacteriota bacterium]
MKHRNWKYIFCWFCLLVPCARAAEPVTTAWITNPAASTNRPLARVQPEVHAVNVRDQYIELQSAGLSLYYLGPLQTPLAQVERLRQFIFHIPRFPAPASANAHPSVRPDVLGVFVNGVPIYNQFEAASYQGQNLWHFDPLAGGDDGTRVANGYARDATHTLDLGLLENLIADGTRHSPLLGFAFDGYPIYGPWGYVNGETQSLRRMRSGCQLRRIERRTAWPDGTALTPSQYGPPVNADFPLGTFSEDYEYSAGTSDLDEFNGRFAITPEYPAGTYAYFLSTDARGRLAYPYLLGGRYYGQVAEAELKTAFRDAAAGSEDCPTAGRELLALTKPQLELKAYGETLAAGQPLRLSFAVRQTNGAPVRALEYVHERPLHLLVVSEDLAEFAHIHPVLVAGDRYEVTHTFPHGGRWRLYADCTPPGSAQRVESFVLTLSGPAPAATPLVADAVLQKEQVGLKLNLALNQPLRAGEEVELAFTIRDAKSGQAISDLEPFLGAWAHFVIIDERQESFIHAHPLEAPQFAPTPTAPHVHNEAALGPPPAIIRTLTSFPRAGLYKLWAQFQRGGQVITQPFVLQVGAAQPPSATVAVAIPSHASKLELGPHGYEPAQLTIAAGQPVTLAVTARQRPGCASRIVFPSLGLTRALPLNGTILIELPALPAGELSFGCGMGMYKGALIIR